MKYTIKGVTIGDRFKYKNFTAIVTDIGAIKSLKSGSDIGYICYAQTEGTLAQNTFEIPFSTVVRNKIIKQ